MANRHRGRPLRAALDVMVQLRAEIEQGRPMTIVADIDRLEATLRDAAEQSRSRGRLNIIFLYAPTDDYLTLVVGGEETVIGFNRANNAPPYFVSSGESA